MKSKTLRGHYYADFDAFKVAIEQHLDGISTIHRKSLLSLMTLKFQTFQNVPLWAA